METILGKGFGRILVISFKRGELLLEGIKEKISEYDIKNAVLVSGIGTLEKAVFHRVNSFDEIPDNEFITIEEPIELSTIQGIIANGEPHFHVVFSDLDKTYSGHLEDGCIVEYLAEIVIAEILDAKMERYPYGEGVKLLGEQK